MRVIIEPHDPLWAGKYERESRLVAQALDTTCVAIHHIGSTSIPAIHAKPIIDMLVEVTAVDAVDSRNGALSALGYEALGEYGIPGRRYFRKDNDAGAREYQAHLFAAGSPEVERHIAFRDFLRAHPEPARRYSDLKRGLAGEHPDDIETYMDGKEAFIQDMERKALTWKRAT